MRTPQFIEASDTIRVAAREAVLRELEVIGSRRKRLLSDADDELERLAAFLNVASAAGIRQNEIAERAGVSRQTLVNLRNEGRGRGYDWNLDLEAMLALAFQGPQTVESLASLLPQVLGDEIPIQAALDRLTSAGAAAWAGAAMSGDNRQDYFKLTPQGVEELPSRLRQAAIPENKRWTAYVATAQTDADTLAEVGQSILGEYRVGVIPANTMQGMEQPEIAFYVDAPSFDDAVSGAAAFYGELRKRAQLNPEPAHVTAVIPPQARGRAAEQARSASPRTVEADFERLRSYVESELQAPAHTHNAGTSMQDIADLAQRVPAAAILEAQIRIEEDLREALESIGEAPAKSEDGSALARRAFERTLLTAETLNAVEGATVMRNLAVHGPRREISVKQAEEFVAIADAVRYAIRQNVKLFTEQSAP
jgi:DNA-binding XRE family transcriptional regulator